MSDEDVFRRLAAMEADVPVFDLRDTRNLNRYQSSRVLEAWAAISEWPLLLYSPSGINQTDHRHWPFLRQPGAEILFLDYIQHPPIEVLGVKTEFERVTRISANLCDLGRSTNVPIVVLSQLSRPDKKGLGQREPTMEDLRQSGQLEQDADIVVLLYRPGGEPTEDGKPTWTRKDKIIIGKQRNGPAGEAVLVSYNGPKYMYEPRGAISQ
jgi:replicative DNA helicase